MHWMVFKVNRVQVSNCLKHVRNLPSQIESNNCFQFLKLILTFFLGIFFLALIFFFWFLIVIFMTANDISKLPPALLRPGRMDMKMELGYADAYQIQEMFWQFFGHDPDTLEPVMEGERKEFLLRKKVEFADRIPADYVTTAELENYFITLWMTADAQNPEKGLYARIFDGIPEFLEKVKVDREQAKEHERKKEEDAKKQKEEEAVAAKKEETASKEEEAVAAKKEETASKEEEAVAAKKEETASKEEEPVADKEEPAAAATEVAKEEPVVKQPQENVDNNTPDKQEEEDQEDEQENNDNDSAISSASSTSDHKEES
ncbi:hypothetical protein BDA99DRAFT_235867 [Phascolomyces articulosus]|uniref:Uncharacterized protein n=1 Tax=Phascolomyces articulosus TaxID=60185 RepID=A0AAD5PID9_9FUNG|nr:hypothetical protein BDA99DRAFT_235867 [Phascolomyces articulosus]